MSRFLFHFFAEVEAGSIVKVDLTEDALLLGILAPLISRRKIYISGYYLNEDELARICVLKSRVVFDEAVRNTQSLSSQDVQADRVEQFLELSDHAEDVTSEMLARVRGVVTKSEGVRMVERDPNSVFLVHGRDQQSASHMRTILRSMGIRVIEWEHALAMTGSPTPYVGDIIECGLAAAGATLVLLTGDDEVKLRPEFQLPHDGVIETDRQHQARPNVYYEAGLADGLDKGRVVLVEVGDVKPFSDASGRHVVRYDGSPTSRNSLAQRLRTCGAQVNTSGSDWLQIPFGAI